MQWSSVGLALEDHHSSEPETSPKPAFSSLISTFMRSYLSCQLTSDFLYHVQVVFLHMSSSYKGSLQITEQFKNKLRFVIFHLSFPQDSQLFSDSFTIRHRRFLTANKCMKRAVIFNEQLICSHVSVMAMAVTYYIAATTTVWDLQDNLK